MWCTKLPKVEKKTGKNLKSKTGYDVLCMCELSISCKIQDGVDKCRLCSECTLASHAA